MNGRKGPIRSRHDPILRELEEFAQFFELWYKDLTERRHPTEDRRYTSAEVDGMFITRHLYYDLRLAVHGFVGMCRYYLGDEINYDNVFFPQAFNQDLLENHFRNLRDAGDCRNPNA